MENSDRTVSFLKGALVGAVVGAAAGVLFAPKSGRETREDIKETALAIKDSALEAYEDASAAVERKVREIKKLGKKINKEKYDEIVDEIVEEMKTDRTVTPAAARKLKTQMRRDWRKVERAVTA
jgi:gas vesicle protein